VEGEVFGGRQASDRIRIALESDYRIGPKVVAEVLAQVEALHPR